MLELKIVLVLVAVGVLVVFTSRRTRVRPRKIDLTKTSDAMFERLTVEVDAAKIRTIRDTKGPISAIKEIRADFPGTSLADAKRYLETLD